MPSPSLIPIFPIWKLLFTSIMNWASAKHTPFSPHSCITPGAQYSFPKLMSYNAGTGNRRHKNHHFLRLFVEAKLKKQNTKKPQPALFRFIVYFSTEEKTRYRSRELSFQHWNKIFSPREKNKPQVTLFSPVQNPHPAFKHPWQAKIVLTYRHHSKNKSLYYRWERKGKENDGFLPSHVEGCISHCSRLKLKLNHKK